MAYHRLPYCLVVFGVFTLEGIGHEILVDKNLRMKGIFLLELLDVDIVLFRRLNPGRRHLRSWMQQRCSKEGESET